MFNVQHLFLLAERFKERVCEAFILPMPKPTANNDGTNAISESKKDLHRRIQSAAPVGKRSTTKESEEALYDTTASRTTRSSSLSGRFKSARRTSTFDPNVNVSMAACPGKEYLFKRSNSQHDPLRSIKSGGDVKRHTYDA